MAQSIPEIMMKEHKKIVSMLENLQNPDSDLKIFSEFKWTLEKHIFVEEKLFFQVYSSCINIECEEMETILKEHKEILFLLKKIENALSLKQKPDFSELKSLLTAHARLEDELLYPRFEEELTEEQKSLIIERSKEVIR